MPTPAHACSVHGTLCLQDLANKRLTVGQMQSPACQPLVADMCLLLRRLMELSHLDDTEQMVICGWQGGRVRDGSRTGASR